MKLRKSFRRIVVDGHTYQYKIGREHIIIYNNSDKRFDTDLSEVTGLTWEEIERRLWKKCGTFCGPKQIARWIRRNKRKESVLR